MPSGPKKRKAAKRKKEDGGVHPPAPHSPTTRSQGNGGSDYGLTDEEAEGERREMEASEPAAAAAEAELPVSEDKEVGVEFVQSGESGESAAGGAAEIVVPAVGEGVPVSEEMVEAVEAVAVSSEVAAEGSAAVEAPAKEVEVEVKEEVPREVAVGEEHRETEGSGAAEATEVASAPAPAPAPAAPLMEHRASLLNCCGLLDVFRGSER